MAKRNRTIDNTGVLMSGNLVDIDAVTGTGVTPVQAAAVAQPLKDWLDSLPYYLDDQGVLAYKSATTSLSHTPALRYAPPHPLAGQLIEALYTDGAYATMRGGAPMPFIDFDMIGPHALQQFLLVMNQILTTQASAT